MESTIDLISKQLLTSDKSEAYYTAKSKRAKQFFQFRRHKNHKKSKKSTIRRFHLKVNMDRELCWLADHNFQDARLSLRYKKAISYQKKRPPVHLDQNSPANTRKLTGNNLKTLLTSIENLPAEEKNEWEVLIRGLYALPQRSIENFELMLQRLTPLPNDEIQHMKKSVKELRLVLPEVRDGLVWAIDNWQAISDAERAKWTKVLLRQHRIAKETRLDMADKLNLLAPLTPKEIEELKNELRSLKPVHRKTEHFR